MSYESGWFLEKNAQWPGQCMGLELKKGSAPLLQTTTKIGQKLEVFDSSHWGRVLLLDGVIQLTEKDECSYQEMLMHTPLNCWKPVVDSDSDAPENSPRGARVLIVGGGDGGMAREALKYKAERVREVVQCEIDGEVVEAAKKYFPKMSSAYTGGDERYTLKIDDAVNYVKSLAEKVRSGGEKSSAPLSAAEKKQLLFDVIVVDSSDPVGPAEKLFSEEFYVDCCSILSENGVMGAQGECLWIHQPLMEGLLESTYRGILTSAADEHANSWMSAQYASIQTPTYPCGQISIFLLSKDGRCAPAGEPVSLEQLQRWGRKPWWHDPAEKKVLGDVLQGTPDERYDTQDPAVGLRYYSPMMHEAAFILPRFLEVKFEKVLKNAHKIAQAAEVGAAMAAEQAEKEAAKAGA